MGMSELLLNSIQDMIKFQKFNPDYLDTIIDCLSVDCSNDFNHTEILTLIYSNVDFFELVFKNFYKEDLYVPGKIFNNRNSIILTELLEKNTNIKHIIIDLCMPITDKSLIYLYTLNTLKSINIELIILDAYIPKLFENKDFKMFVDNNIIYKIDISNCNYISDDYQDYFNSLISNNKIIHLNYSGFYVKLNNTKLINALISNSSLETLHISNLTINNELYSAFKKHKLLSSFLHYDVLYDLTSYHMLITKQLNDDILCDLIEENEQKIIFSYMKIWEHSLNETFYNTLKNKKVISKIVFKKVNINCKLLADLLLNNNTIDTIIIEDSTLINFDYLSDIFKYNKTLNKLKIYNSSFINHTSEDVFNSLKDNSSLTSLDIDSNHLTINDIKNITKSLKSNSTLCDLRLIHYNGNNSFINEICDILQYNTTLTSLNFNYSSEYTYINNKYVDISIEESKRLGEVLKINSSLVSLNLKSLKTEYITPIIEALKSNSMLTSFNLPTYNLSKQLLDKRITMMLNYNTTLTELNFN